jgi:hypothetical protein
MFWGDDGFRILPDSRAQQILKKIRLLRSKGNLLSLSEGSELKILENELLHIQSNCMHTFRAILLLNRHRKFCTQCDKEDVTYRHQD